MRHANPGVSLSVRWGERELAREFFPLDTPRAFTVGSAPGCDFACGGVKSLVLLDVDRAGAAVRGAALVRGEVQEVAVGALHFEAQLLDRPPQVKAKATGADLAVVNVGLVLLALFGVFAVAAANADAEGGAFDDDLSGTPARAVKALIRREVERRQSSALASAAAPRMTKERPTPQASPSHHARQLPPSRPTGRPSKVDVGSLFQGPGIGAVFASSGLGNALKVASSGLRTADTGTGVGILGTGHGMDGNGLGGMGLQGIGALGTRGGRGKDAYGTGVVLNPGEKPKIVPFPDPELEECKTEGSGCLDKELIRRVIRANLAGFRYCYESRLNRFPNLEGKVSARFTISQSGRVVAAEVGQSTANNAELEQCVLSRTRLLQFPSSKWAGLVVVSYPFIFKQSGK